MASTSTGATGPYGDDEARARSRAMPAAPVIGTHAGTSPRAFPSPWGARQRSATVAVHGAMTLEGRELVRSLLDAAHPPTQLRLYDDAPGPLSYRDRPLLVRRTPAEVVPTNLAFLAGRGAAGRAALGRLVDAGVRVVDLAVGGHDPEVPLVVPGLLEREVGAFTQLVTVPRGPLAWLAPLLARLDAVGGLREVTATWVAPAAADGLEALLAHRRGAGRSARVGACVGPALEGFDPRLLRRLLDAPALAVELAAVTAGAARGDLVQVHARLQRDLAQDEARRALAGAPGVRSLAPEEELEGGPSAAAVEGRTHVEVGRLRAGVRGAGSLSFVAVGDHLLAGVVRSALAAAALLPLG